MVKWSYPSDMILHVNFISRVTGCEISSHSKEWVGFSYSMEEEVPHPLRDDVKRMLDQNPSFITLWLKDGGVSRLEVYAFTRKEWDVAYAVYGYLKHHYPEMECEMGP